MKIGYVWSWQKISGHDFLVNGGPKADMRDITRAIIISHRVSAWNTIRSALVFIFDLTGMISEYFCTYT